MNRVNKANPCPICQKDSWCCYDEQRCLCMRVESKSPYTLKSGEIGWWHDLKDKPQKYVPKRKEPEVHRIDAEGMMKWWFYNTKQSYTDSLAEDLGVSRQSLDTLRVAWSDQHKAFAFPMRDGMGRICGIRLRGDDGKKWSVTGSKSGIFLPFCEPCNTVWICEGGTDAAALLSLGLFPIGRPSCSGGTDEINATIRRLKIHKTVIIADSDRDREIGGKIYNSGVDGALRLSERLVCSNCVIALPVKDSREFLRCGGTREMLEGMAASTIWRHP